MKAMSYTAVRNNLAKTMDQVIEDHAPVIITRRTGGQVVLMSLDDFNSWAETVYLLRSPENARRLRGALDQARRGKAKLRPLAR